MFACDEEEDGDDEQVEDRDLEKESERIGWELKSLFAFHCCSALHHCFGRNGRCHGIWYMISTSRWLSVPILHQKVCKYVVA